MHDYIFNERLVLIGEDGAKWGIGDKTAFIAEGKYWVNNHAHVVRPLKNKAIDTYIVFILIQIDLTRFITGVTVPKLNQEKLKPIKIPLPPLEVQKEIVKELDRYQKIIDGAKAIVINYKPSIKIDPKWPMVRLENACIQITDGTHKTPNYAVDGVPFLRVTDLTGSDSSKKFISKEEHRELIKRCKPEKGDVLYSKNGTIGVAKLVEWDWEFSIFVSLALLKPDRNRVDPKYLEIFLNSPDALSQAKSFSKSGTVTNLHLIEIKRMIISVPDLDTQRKIVQELMDEQKTIESAKLIISLFEQKIKSKIEEVWSS